jgi:hypothetical protein
MTLTEFELKRRCDLAAAEVLETIRREAGDLPRSHCVAIAMGAAAALAVASGISRDQATEILHLSWGEITISLTRS